jgi:hypothetical protein
MLEKKYSYKKQTKTYYEDQFKIIWILLKTNQDGILF